MSNSYEPTEGLHHISDRIMKLVTPMNINNFEADPCGTVRTKGNLITLKSKVFQSFSPRSFLAKGSRTRSDSQRMASDIIRGSFSIKRRIRLQSLLQNEILINYSIFRRLGNLSIKVENLKWKFRDWRRLCAMNKEWLLTFSNAILLTCFVNITKTIMEQFERMPKHDTMNDDTIAIADIISLSQNAETKIINPDAEAATSNSCDSLRSSVISCLPLFYAFSDPCFSFMHRYSAVRSVTRLVSNPNGFFCKQKGERTTQNQWSTLRFEYN